MALLPGLLTPYLYGREWVLSLRRYYDDGGVMPGRGTHTVGPDQGELVTSDLLAQWKPQEIRDMSYANAPGATPSKVWIFNIDVLVMQNLSSSPDHPYHTMWYGFVLTHRGLDGVTDEPLVTTGGIDFILGTQTLVVPNGVVWERVRNVTPPIPPPT